jgi:hypothetical protein
MAELSISWHRRGQAYRAAAAAGVRTSSSSAGESPANLLTATTQRTPTNASTTAHLPNTDQRPNWRGRPKRGRRISTSVSAMVTYGAVLRTHSLTELLCDAAHMVLHVGASGLEEVQPLAGVPAASNKRAELRTQQRDYSRSRTAATVSGLRNSGRSTHGHRLGPRRTPAYTYRL